jgi:DNA invertase Pin-like site-specific DNA recombinase
MPQENGLKAIRQVQHAPPPIISLLRVAAYCRVSSDSEDQRHSYAAQIKYYTEHIGQQSNWVLADIYCDEAVTGTKTDKRDDLKRLVTDARRGKIDRVLVKSISRFARNTYDSLALARLLKSYGVSVYFEEQDIDTGTMSDEFIYTMQSMAAQGESITISQNMRWHYREVMESGEFIGTIPAYGYRLVGGTLEIYKPEASIVRRIFAMYLSGMGKQAIANTLNSEGVPRRYGYKTWHKDTVAYILSNERVVGDALLQKSFATEEFPFRQVRNKGEKPQYYVENSHLPIISREDFDAVQELQTRKRSDTYRVSNHALTGKIRCPDCGRPFRRQIINDTAYWQCCYHASGKTKCGGHRYPEEAVYDAFLLLVNKLITHREAILPPLIAGLERIQSHVSRAGNKVYEIDKQIAALNTKIHTFAKHRSSGLMDAADFAAESGMVNRQIGTLRAERRKLLAEDETDEMIDELRGLDSLLAQTELQTDFDSELFGQVIAGITAVSHNELCFKLHGGLELTETINRTERRANP